jgi:oxygen-independent coproporphyrinogen-3 oxidase
MNFAPLEQRLRLYETQGLAQKRGERWRLTPQGFLVSNQIIGQLLELQEQATLEDTLERVRTGGTDSHTSLRTVSE